MYVFILYLLASRKFEYSTFDACNQTAAIPMHYSTINKSVDILDTASMYKINKIKIL